MTVDAVWAALAASATYAALHSLLPHHSRSPAPAASGLRPPRTARRGRRRSVDHAAEWADALDAIAAEVRSGSSLTTAIERTARRSPGDGAAVALHALGAAATLGGPVAATLQHGALVLRDRHAAQAESAAHSAQARLSAAVLTALPLAFTAFAMTTSPSFRAAALSPPGVVAMALGGALNLIGRHWMSRLVGRSSR